MISRLQQTLSGIYSGRVKRLSIQVGLHPLVLHAWRALRRIALAMEYHMSSSPHSVSVNDATATFLYADKQEFERITTLAEEGPIIRDLIRRIRSGDTVWDIGGNVGLYTCLLASVVPDGVVIAFEPHPGHADRLRENVTVNELKNIDIRQLALGDASGTIELQVINEEDHHEGRHSIRGDLNSDTSISVDLRRGDELVADGMPAPNVIKLDIEGAELAALRGMRETLTREQCRYVQCEVHTHQGVEVDAVISHLDRAGFTTDVFFERGTETFVVGSKT